MNNLSWFIYGAEVLSNLSGLLIVFGILAGLAALISIIAYFVMNADCPTEYDLQWAAKWLYILKRMIPLSFVLLFFGCLLPSHQTMVMIAVSEIGDRAIHSTQVQGLIDPSTEYFQKWLKKEIETLDEKKEKK